MDIQKNEVRWSQTLISLAWPFFAFVILIGFWKPLHEIAERLPNALDRSQTINIAGLKLEFENDSRFRRPSPIVATAMKEMYTEDLKVLMNTPDAPTFAKPEKINEYRERYKHLIELGLAEERDSYMVEGGSNIAGVTYRLTSAGRNTKEYIIEIIIGTLLGRDTKPSAEKP